MTLIAGAFGCAWATASAVSPSTPSGPAARSGPLSSGKVLPDRAAPGGPSADFGDRFLERLHFPARAPRVRTRAALVSRRMGLLGRRSDRKRDHAYRPAPFRACSA